MARTMASRTFSSFLRVVSICSVLGRLCRKCARFHFTLPFKKKNSFFCVFTFLLNAGSQLFFFSTLRQMYIKNKIMITEYSRTKSQSLSDQKLVKGQRPKPHHMSLKYVCFHPMMKSRQRDHLSLRHLVHITHVSIRLVSIRHHGSLTCALFMLIPY